MSKYDLAILIPLVAILIIAIIIRFIAVRLAEKHNECEKFISHLKHRHLSITSHWIRGSTPTDGPLKNVLNNIIDFEINRSLTDQETFYLIGVFGTGYHERYIEFLKKHRKKIIKKLTNAREW